MAAEVEYERALQGANQSIQSAELLVAQAQGVLREAREAREQLAENPSYRPLEKQIELLRLQLGQAAVVAPGSGTVLQVYGVPGERASVLPLIEMADLTQMSCLAEVAPVIASKAEMEPIRPRTMGRTWRLPSI
jgi:multidrug resistance efflux pump